MPQNPSHPGIYVQEVAGGVREIAGVETSLAAFVGFLGSGPADEPVLVRSYQEFERGFGGLDPGFPMSYALYCFFANGGRQAWVLRVERGAASAPDALIGLSANTGLAALAAVDSFNLLCVPDTFDLPEAEAAAVANAAIALCEARRAFYLLDAPGSRRLDDIAAWVDTLPHSRNAAVYFPAIGVADPRDSTQTRMLAPSGAVAGVIVRTDSTRGVWKAAAGSDAYLNGVRSLAVVMTDAENGLLNPMGVNALRRFANHGFLVWGARTLAGADALGDQYKYAPVRRLALYIEQSLERGLQWAVFEPNGEALWSALRLQVSNFMQTIYRSGALQGVTPKEAWFVQCGPETTSQSDIDAGMVNVVVGFAPTRPAEFLILTLRLSSAPAGG